MDRKLTHKTIRRLTKYLTGDEWGVSRSDFITLKIGEILDLLEHEKALEWKNGYEACKKRFSPEL